MSVKDGEEFLEFLKLFNISCEQRDPSVPIVVPARIVEEFRSSSGCKYKQLLSLNEFKSTIKIMTTHVYLHSRLFQINHYPRLPEIPNGLKLFVYDKGISPINKKDAEFKETRITTQFTVQSINRITTQMSMDILAANRAQGVLETPKDDTFRLNEFIRQMISKYPDYYMKFLPYGSEVYGVTCSGVPRYLNVNIEMDEPDLMRLVERKCNPFTADFGEPHCYPTTLLFNNKPAKLKSPFNMTRVDISDFEGIEYSFNKPIVTKSTDLIREYLHLDDRVGPFLQAMKQFVLSSKLDNEIPMYGFMLMGLSYLISIDPAVIPNLQNISLNQVGDVCLDEECLTKYKFWDTAIYQGRYIGAASRYHTCVIRGKHKRSCRYIPIFDPSRHKNVWMSVNSMSLGELFLDCMCYYGYHFDYNEFAVSLKFDGKTRKKPVFSDHSMVVEDPFLAGINLVKQVDSAPVVKRKFREAFTVLLNQVPLNEVILRNEGIYFDVRDVKRFYSARSRKKKTHNCVKDFLVLGLNVQEGGTCGCHCELIQSILGGASVIREIKSLDKHTIWVSITSHEDITLPVNFVHDSKIIHIVELFDVSR